MNTLQFTIEESEVDINKEFVQQMQLLSEKKDSIEIIDFIFNYYLIENKDISFGEVLNHLDKAIDIDPNLLIEFMISDNDYNISELNNLEFINLLVKLKLKYGIIIRRKLESSQDPFGLKSAEINIKTGETTHTLILNRNDNKQLKVNFKPSTLLPILTMINQGLYQSLTSGIYNLESHDILNYLENSNILSKHFYEIMEKNK